MTKFLMPWVLVLCAAKLAAQDWPSYLGDAGRTHYSTLAQIHTGNVDQLELAWEYHTGDAGEMQCNPLIVKGVLYGLTAGGGVFALDAANGKELWLHPITDAPTKRTLRGLVYWSHGDDRRILFTRDDWLGALNAATGEPILDFGENGRVDLKVGLGERAQSKWLISTTPGTLCGDLLVVPTRVGEEADAAPGFIQAFDVRTGRLAWVFRTIPAPGETGYETWSKDAHRNVSVGGANCWAGMAVDEERNLLFVPTGSASPDFWGGDRVGRNLYANCLLALDGSTGRLRWYYQFVRHDLWDRDLPAPPSLVTVRRDGRRIDAVAQVTKSGHVFVFDRETGKSLFPIEERLAPASSLPGERAWPSQPVPTRPAPFARQALTEDDLNPYSSNREELLSTFRSARKGCFEPFGTYDTLVVPGFVGGAEWGGAAVDPEGVLYVNANEMPWIARLLPTADDAISDLSPGHRLYATFCVACHGAERQGNPASGFPSLVDVSARLPRAEISQLVTHGKGMMPGFTFLSPTDKQQLVDFLLGAERVEGARSPTRGSAPVGGASGGRATAPYRLKGYVKFIDADGYPAIRPPWGTLTAIDLNTGEHRWRVSLGEFPELTAQGIPPTGSENFGGPVVTAGGLVFIAATKDDKIRAFDRKDGRLLWESALPASGLATPSVYAVEGRQFVVIAAGGGKAGLPAADSYVAFALPAETRSRF